MADLKRANRVTAYWGGEGVAIANFYKTHDKVGILRSDSEEVKNAGFKMPESTEDVQVTAQDKLAAYKNFVMANAAMFGIQYDPVDRRNGDFKFPNTYNEETFRKFSRDIAINTINAVIAKVQTNVIDKLIASGAKPEGTTVDFGISDEPTKVDITETYKNGNLKYAQATFDIVFQTAKMDGENAIEPIQEQSTIIIDLVSGQLKKPREFGDGTLTTAGIKTFMIEKGLIPKPEEKKKEDPEDGTVPIEEGVAPDDQTTAAEEPADAPADTQAPAEEKPKARGRKKKDAE